MIAAFQIIRMISFALFVALGLRAAIAPEASRRRAVNHLLIYMLFVSAVAGFSQRDNWPFSPYTLAAFRARTDKPFCLTAFSGVTRDGREWDVDPMAWSPVYSSILQYWFEQHFTHLTPAQQKTTMHFLLRKAEASRRDLHAGDGLGFERLIGSAAITYWWLLPRHTNVPPEPYRGLRVYRSCVTPEEMFANGRGATRVLIAEER